jgi:hypothetical protein
MWCGRLDLSMDEHFQEHFMGSRRTHHPVSLTPLFGDDSACDSPARRFEVAGLTIVQSSSMRRTPTRC